MSDDGWHAIHLPDHSFRWAFLSKAGMEDGYGGTATPVLDEAVALWLAETVAPRRWRLSVVQRTPADVESDSFFFGGFIAFEDARDAVHFVLRWGDA